MASQWSTMAVPVALVVGTLALLATRALRTDGVAMLALAAAVLTGLVPADRALSGFADPVVITLGAFVILAAAVHRSGIVELLRGTLTRRWRLTTPIMLAGGGLVALLAAISGRVGTRAALLRNVPTPATDDGRPMFMLDLACLLGGTLTVVGGVPNLLVSAVRAEQLGTPFPVFAFLPVGALLLAAGMLLFALGSIASRATAARAGNQVDPLRRVRSFAAEVALPPGSPLAGRSVAAFEAAADNAFHVAALVREDFRRIEARPDWILLPGDVLMLDCEPAVLHRLVERFGLQPADGPFVRLASLSGIGLVEAVVTGSSPLIGKPASADFGPAAAQAGLHLLGIGRNDDHPPARLRRTRLRAGDILVLAAEADSVPQTLSAFGCLPLAERRLRLGHRQLAALPLVTLLLALAAAATGAAPLWLALLAGVILLVLSRLLTLREIYETIPWPALVMVASLLPLEIALHDSAATAAAARFLAPFAAAAGPVAAVAATLALTMLAATLFGAAVAALLLAPFALSLAVAAGLPADMLLVAIAVGAAIDAQHGDGLLAAHAPGAHLGPRSVGRHQAVIAAFLLVCGSLIIATLWRA